MDYSDESYVRLYTRDTVQWRMLPWQAKALWPLLLRRFDKAGLLDLAGEGIDGLAVLVELPGEVVSPGLAALLDRGWLQLVDGHLFDPSFLERETATKSDAQRQRDSRATRQAAAKAEAARAALSAPACGGGASSRNVTEGHVSGLSVTPGHDVSLCAVPVPDPLPDLSPLPPAAGAAGGGASREAGAFRGGSGTRQRGLDPAVETLRAEIRALGGPDYSDPASWKALRRLLRKGATLDDALLCLRWCATQSWQRADLELNPAVLFAPKQFASGLARARASPLARPAPATAPRPARKVGDRDLRLCTACGHYNPAEFDGSDWNLKPHDCAAGARMHA